MNRDAIQAAVDTDYAGHIEDDDYGTPCDVCRGEGGWTWTVEYQGRDVETDRDCPNCEGRGRVL